MTTLLNKLEETARLSPDRPAYRVGTQTVSYAFLAAKAKYYGALLQKEGTSPVIVYGHKEPEMLVSMLACLYAGRAYVPADVSLPSGRLQNMITQTGTTLLLTAREVKAEGVRICSLEGLRMFEAAAPQQNDNRTAYIIFTSGSTGQPKGVPIAYENLENFVRWEKSLPGLSDLKAVTVCNHALFSFDLSVADVWFALCAGHTLAAIRSENCPDLNEIFSVLKQSAAAVMTPTFARLCLTEPDFCAENFPALACIYFCGETLQKTTAARLFDRFPKLRLINAYGPTEATSAVCAVLITPGMLQSEAPLPVGDVKNAATEIMIEDGEIVLKGKSVSAGYLGRSAGGFFTENGVQCYRTGDRGEIRNGLLYFYGRGDGQIKYKGFRIELGEIENVLLRLPGVCACAVVPKTGADGTVRSLAAFLEAANGVSPDTVRQGIGQTLPGYMIPKTIKILLSLPVTPNGKTDKRKLMNI